MTFQHINPAQTHDPSHIYTHVVVPPPGRVVFLAGQWGGDQRGELADGGFLPQVRQAFDNVQILLDAVGIGPGEVTKLTHYVVGLGVERRAALHQHVGTIWSGDRPASTLLGVERLARDGMLYEVDVQAVIPD